ITFEGAIDDAQQTYEGNLPPLEYERHLSLVHRILNDTGDEPGNLALMAYALDELYHGVDDNKRLTFTAYNALGGVEGAIGKRAESTCDALELDDKEAILQQVFRELVAVDERGTATRQRAKLSKFGDSQRVLIDAFVDARLLVTHEEMVEVAHEAIFRSWERLVEWIESAQEDLILLRQVKTAAAEWVRQNRADAFRWAHERLEPVYAMVERLHPDLSETEKAFIEPEQERLYRELADINTSHQRRYDIGERLARIGDTRDGIGVKDGVPNMLWLPVNGSDGTFSFEFGDFEVSDFFIAKYLTTKAQLDAFLASDWDDPQWWQGFPDKYQSQNFSNVVNGNTNAPRDTISWYQSIAFGRWMTAQFDALELEHPSGAILRVGENAQIRIPTEWEWQWVAMNGTDERDYPWGEWDDHPRANTTEAGINDRSTAVGMYPDGTAVCGALDIAGNLREWCLNDYGDSTIVDGFGNEERKVLRGGSFDYYQNFARSSSRNYHFPFNANYSYGCRLVVAPI
ncbi:MAG: SUMF1/EgtB/PvdO family nonheme iron enzyme, partial [Chloroflexota bacterium]